MLLFPSQAKIAAAMSVPMTLFTITNATLGLLLVFRTNASYGRWDEARKMWGLMVNRTRSGREGLGTTSYHTLLVLHIGVWLDPQRIAIS